MDYIWLIHRSETRMFTLTCGDNTPSFLIILWAVSHIQPDAVPHHKSKQKGQLCSLFTQISQVFHRVKKKDSHDPIFRKGNHSLVLHWPFFSKEHFLAPVSFTSKFLFTRLAFDSFIIEVPARTEKANSSLAASDCEHITLIYRLIWRRDFITLVCMLLSTVNAV